MTTVAELREQASKLELKGYSRLKKPELEELIHNELRRREELKLNEIRNAKVERPKSGLHMPDPELDFSLDIPESDYLPPVTVVRGKGIDNMARVRNYCYRQPGKDRLTVAEARRIRKNWRKGDMTVPSSLIFAGIKVSTAMGV